MHKRVFVDDVPERGWMIGDPTDDRFPAVQSRRSRPINEARRVLWRAFQHGGLSEEEFASTVDRLRFGSGLPDPSPD